MAAQTSMAVVLVAVTFPKSAQRGQTEVELPAPWPPAQRRDPSSDPFQSPVLRHGYTWLMAATRESVPARSRGARLLRARHSLLAERVLLIERFIHSESVSAAILFAASVVALVCANSPWRVAYFDLWHHKLMFDVGFFTLSKDLHHWINDGLMAVFFFSIGLEMKAGLSGGELSSPRQAALPAIAALGGMLAPAAIYLFWNDRGPAAGGWGIPMATYIALH
jgi:hypothetical protein